VPRAYVIGALIPRGGTFMAYHIGLILAQEFGYEVMNVQIREQPLPPQFKYELIPPTINIGQMEQSITDDDVLVVNPSFSHFMFGLRLPGRKICYVQGFTFRTLDCYFDLYVSASTIVRKFLFSVYDIETPIIPPFIQFNELPQVKPWRERPQSVLMYIKAGEENQAAAAYLQREIRARLPHIKLGVLKDNGLPYAEFLRRIGGARYLINVSLAEGFGLIPLEAMALGTCVTGLDGLAGQDYMHFGKNSMTCTGKDILRIPEILEQLLRDETLAEKIATQGIADAQVYTLVAFRQAWISRLREFLK